MNNQEFDNNKGLAKWALALFIIGILGAILICAHAPTGVLRPCNLLSCSLCSLESVRC